VFSSAGASAGKSVTVVNLAVSLAQSGFSTLVIDANLRRPSVHMKLGTKNDEGLSQLVPSGDDPEVYVQSSPLAVGLDVIPAGPPPLNPAELLGSRRMVKLIEWAQEHYHYVLVDTPPLDVFTDAAVMAHHLDGLFIVVRFDATDHRRLSEALDQLETSGIPLLGFIVNGREPAQSRAQRYARSVGVRNFKTLWTDRSPAGRGGTGSANDSASGGSSPRAAYPDEDRTLEPALLAEEGVGRTAGPFDGMTLSGSQRSLWEDAAGSRAGRSASGVSDDGADDDLDDEDLSALSFADRRDS
jgi:capsular exopolysaccharide synthesis family protein